ncbi:MAG: LLM class flavin-dependent oxidoreductase [Anaerolineaceae bacterium]|nr:LLM class flavin-dependent oxidoreductase [Anaerolineaceae bacterium]
MKIKIGTSIFWENEPFERIVEIIEMCEELGYDHLWIPNEKFFHEMYVTATVAALKSTSPQIGTYIVDPYTFHPALTAISIASLDQVSAGRAILAIGAGGTGFPVMGIERKKPALAIKETIQIVRGLLKGDTVTLQGEVRSINAGRLNFKTRAGIPIIVASRGDSILKVAGEVADGAMIATYAEPVGVSHALSLVKEGAVQAGRSLRDLTLISRVDTCISKDRKEAIQAVKWMIGVFLWTSYPDRRFVHHVGLDVPAELEKIIAWRDYNLIEEYKHLIPDEFADKFCWAGTAEEVAQKIAAVVNLGIENITINPQPPEGGDIIETIQEFAQTVKPLVEEMTR